MARRQPAGKRLATAARWPLGVALTAWRYMWRTIPVHRWEMAGSLPADAPPDFPAGTDRSDIQGIEEGTGPLVHRLYRTRMVGTALSAAELLGHIAGNLDSVAPSEFASFQKVGGAQAIEVGDEYVIRMPGPYDGPVRVVSVTPRSFRLATLDGHLEAGQIEFRVDSNHRSLEFAIESWARSGDRLSDILYTHLRLAKEVQLHMWTSVLTRVVEVSGGQMEGGIVITTRRVEVPELADARQPSARAGRAPSARAGIERELTSLSGLALNYDPTRSGEYTPENGWRVDDMVETLPPEPSGPPVAGGSWSVARRLTIDYQLADPAVVRAFFREDAPLAGRDMLLRIRFLGLTFDVGVRVGDVYEETRELDGRQARVFGWDYRTLQGHFEQGQMHYEVWKWFDTGQVEFRLHAFSRPAETGPPLLRLGFRLFGRTNQLRFYRQVCRRARRLTEAELESRARSATRSL